MKSRTIVYQIIAKISYRLHIKTQINVENDKPNGFKHYFLQQFNREY